MKKTQSTKRALLMSMLSLVLCLSMLVGTTFAWFTDSVQSGINRIVAGNLDVELEYWDGDSYEAVDSATKLFKDGALWEPGHTEVAYLKVSNVGTLALKYQLSAIFNGEVLGKTKDGTEIRLSDHLVFGVTEKEITAAADMYTREQAIAEAGNAMGLKDYNGKTTSLEVNGEDFVALIVYMPTSVGNEANHNGTDIPSINLGVELYATQMVAESDSFGNDYDEGAWAEGMKVYTAQDLQAAIDAGETYIILEDNITLDEGLVIPAAATTFAMRSAPAAITIDLNGKALNIEAAYDDSKSTASSAVVNNGSLILTGAGTIKALNNYTVRNYGAMVIDTVTIENGIMNYGDLTVESGVISNSRTGKHTIYNNNAMLTINGGTFHNGNPGNATIFAYGGEVELNDGKYTIADGTATLGWTSCLIDAQGGAKYSLTGGTYNGTLRDYNKNMNITGGTFTVNPTEFIAGGYESKKNDDGSFTVQSGPVAKVGNISYYTIDEAIANWTHNTTLTLLKDVTLSDVIKLSSTEYHVLDLGTSTMTAAKSKDAIQIVNNGRSSASYTLDIKANAANPGGITATSKAIVRTSGKSGVKDRPIIRFYNGVFNASNIVNHSGSNGTNCPQFQFHGGEFNGSISTNRSLNQFYGGTFNGSLFMSVDSSAYGLIAGGTFKQLSNLYGSALNKDKFTIGSAKGVFDREVYVNDNGYYVVSAAKPQTIEASIAKKPGTNDYLAYSKIATEGVLNYTDVYVALNNNKTGDVTVYVDELDMTGSTYKGTLKIVDTLTVTFAEGTTPAWSVASAVDGKTVSYGADSVANGVVTRVYTLV